MSEITTDKPVELTENKTKFDMPEWTGNPSLLFDDERNTYWIAFPAKDLRPDNPLGNYVAIRLILDRCLDQMITGIANRSLQKKDKRIIIPSGSGIADTMKRVTAKLNPFGRK